MVKTIRANTQNKCCNALAYVQNILIQFDRICLKQAQHRGLLAV